MSLTSPNMILYLDIETSSKYINISEFEKNEPELYDVFIKKFSNKIITNEFYKQEAPLNPTFGMITCVTIGYEINGELKLKSFDGNEKKILEDCYPGLVNANNHQYKLCGYNILNFDLPWLNVKMLKYKHKIPNLISVFNKKPWEFNAFDIYSEIKMRNISLIDFCYETGIKIPVHRGLEMDEFYWNGQRSKVREHCESDVEAVYNLYKLIYENLK